MLQHVQSLGQAMFLRVESGFNAAFGERLNPFYHLGQIAFFLFWLVAASGLYLYAFFDTGVSGAYASVERITHGHFHVGLLMRGLHRYASDGMVVIMLLHMLRHFCFDRHRGFRWFSWVSGVLLLWLTYVSGISGYMLPWDRLAQFVAVGTAELLDWLPIFNGALMRNFIYHGSVNDRLFSLFSFIHIGVPLTLLLFLWVHIQRVPRAATNPPRAIALSLLATMTVLALVFPVAGHMPADLRIAPDGLSLDWYLLATLPLMYAWSLQGVWVLLIGTTALLVLLPWLPPRRAGSGVRMTVHPGNRELMVRAGETILEAGLRAGMPMPFECRNGGCGACKGTILQGQVRETAHQQSLLTEDERMLGRTLLCVCTPLTDVEVEYEEAGAEKDAEVVTVQATVSALRKAAPDVMIVHLRLPDGVRMPFRAGQYFNVVLDDGARRAFSFATAPEEGDQIEMHVRLVPGGRFTPHVFEAMTTGDVLTLEGPLGRFQLRENARPLLFVAGATGFAPVKSMLEHAFGTGLRRRMILYWGARQRRDLYLCDLAEQWARVHPNFSFVPVLSESGAEDAWGGRTGLVHEAILQDFPDLSGFDVYTCGSLKLVETARPAFIAQGLSEDACFADAFYPRAAEAPLTSR